MNDFDFVAEGKGHVILSINDEGNAVGMDSDHIVVMASGLVLFKSGQGIEVMFGAQAVITEPIWSILEIQATRQPEPSCPKCNDDPSTLHPPICPKCGKVVA